MQLEDYLNENKLYCPVQSGYRKGYGCETLLLKMNDDLMKEADKNNLVALVLLDLSAAFDAIDHGILLKKLQYMYGINSISLQWFKSYLNDRSFCIYINKTQSGIEIILYGVPQGSILGPILFILFTKDLSDIVLKYGFKLHLYADDSTLYVALNPLDPHDIENVKSKLEECLKEIKVWMTSNFMKLNEEKTKLLVFGKRSNLKKHSPFEFTLDLNGNIIKNLDLMTDATEEGKCLGVHLRNDLSMERQIAAVRKTCFGTMYNMRNVKEYLDVETKLLLIKTLILSKLDYCNSLYMNIPKYLVKKLESLLNYCVRFIYKVPKRADTSQFYLKSHILPIDLRIQFKCLLIIQKSIHGSAPDYLKEMIQCCNMDGRYSFRSPNDIFHLQTAHTARTSVFSHRRFTMFAPQIWNTLPAEIRFCLDTESFKKQLKTYLFRDYEGHVTAA